MEMNTKFPVSELYIIPISSSFNKPTRVRKSQREWFQKGDPDQNRSTQICKILSL